MKRCPKNRWQRDIVAGFEDRGGSPGKNGGLEKLERQRNRFSPRDDSFTKITQNVASFLLYSEAV